MAHNWLQFDVDLNGDEHGKFDPSERTRYDNGVITCTFKLENKLKAYLKNDGGMLSFYISTRADIYYR